MLLNLIKVFLLFNNTPNVNAINILQQENIAFDSETYFKAEFAHEVVSTIYKAFRQWFFTIIFCEFTYFENRILKYTETFDNGYPVILLDGCPALNKSKIKPKRNRHGETAYIITSNALSLEANEFALEALKRTAVFKPRSPVIFVINEPVEINSYFFFTMKNHFQLLWSRSVTNSVLVLWSDKLRIYVFNPYFDKIKEVTEVKDIGRLLSKQYHNLYGHELRLSVFRKIFVTDETGPIKCEKDLAKTVIKFLNASCIPTIPKDGLTIGDLLDNGTATGATADLIDGYTDLELESRILKNSYYGYIDTTYPLTQDELCFLIKKEERNSAFQTVLILVTTKLLLIFLFNLLFLIAIAITILKFEIKLWSIKPKQSVSAIVVDLVKCFVRQTVDIKFLGPAFRFQVLLIMIYSLVIDCVIDGILTSAITYPRYKKDMDTLSDLAASKLKLGIHDRHLQLFNNSLNHEQYEFLKNRMEIVNDKKIKQIIERRQFEYAVLMRKSEAHFISRKPSNIKNGRRLYHTMLECPVPCSIVYGLHYGSPYLPRINYILKHLNQAGILQYWIQSEELPFLNRYRKKLYDNDNKEQNPLKMENLKEVFIALLICLFASTFVFFIEIGLFYIRKNSFKESVKY